VPDIIEEIGTLDIEAGQPDATVADFQWYSLLK